MLKRQSDLNTRHEATLPFAAEKIVFAGDQRTQCDIDVATETPINFVYGGMPYAVMMATPEDLHDFVYGFSLTEGIIQKAEDIRDIRVEPAGDHITIKIVLSSAQFQAHLAKRRMMSGRTSCGLCGVETLADLPVAHQISPSDSAPISLDAVHQALGQLAQHQPLNQVTRSVHAAAWCNGKGLILAAREDVGRHNALDKLIGCLLQKSMKAQDGFLLITSRASFEMLEKAALFGIRMIVAISAPTSLAIRRAEDLGVTLYGVARHDSMIKFTSSHTIDREIHQA
jgi:FdhD protein